MRPVYVHDARVTRFGRRGLTLEALAHEAAAPLTQGVEAVFVGNHASELFGDGGNLGVRVAEALALGGVPAVRIDSATSSGASAFAAAADAVAAGRFGRALVVGVERMTHVPTERALEVVASMLAPTERALGATPAALAGLVARAVMGRYGLTRDALADASVWAHEAGARNPEAQFRRAITRQDVKDSPPLADPLRAFDAAPLSDGAAALVLSSTPGPVRVAGIGAATEALALTDRADPDRLVSFQASRVAAARAYAAAQWQPRDVDVAELHDAFSVLAFVAAEDMGLAERGRGHEWLAANRARVNPGGGLKARGHPAGASGAAQLVELFMQLTRGAGARQVPGARKGLAHSVGGFGANSVVTLLEAVA